VIRRVAKIAVLLLLGAIALAIGAISVAAGCARDGR
jgi:hypothetical protein